MNSRWISMLLPSLLLVSFAGCDNKTGAGQETAPGAGKVASAGKTAQVARIVFIGQKDACQCTHDRIDASWAALQAVMEKVKIPVERIQLDLDKAAAERYTKLRSPMVLPGIYFLDDNDKLIDLLQGEVTEKQITKIIR